ncbi:MAG TPA: HDOD domain-containing protein [Sedimenticola sp.]|nr:HDOD domain-containing protein [Sedimenticola sp.]
MEAARQVEDLNNIIYDRFLQDLEDDLLELPSLPEVATRIGRALKEETTDARVIASIVQTDPAMAAKLIKAANSAMYGRCTPVEDCAAAVVRLGTHITHKLVLSFCLRELFRSNSRELQQRMEQLWRHSTRVAAICYVLALHDSRFEPEQAMLIGLLHDIGVVSLLSYAEGFPMEARSPRFLDDLVACLRAQTSSTILSRWRFSPDFVTAALEGEEWMRDTGGDADYCDLVIVAQLHSFVGTEKALHLPTLDQTPAYEHLHLGELSPSFSLRILDEAQEKVAQAEALLNI